MTVEATRQRRRLDRLEHSGVRQANVLVHDANRQILDALRPHLVDERSRDTLTHLVQEVEKQHPVNVAQVRQISPFRYPGGKTWLVPVVREWLKRSKPKVLLEPFAGGGVVSLTAAAEGLADRAIMVELDDDVAAVWQVLINGSDQDAQRLGRLVLGFEVNYDNVRYVLDIEPKDTVDRAFRTIVKNRCQRGGIMAPGAGLVKNGENGRGLASRWYPETLVKRFNVIRDVRHRISFEHGDAFDAIHNYPGATMFIDPPYTAGGKKAGSRLYTHSEVDHSQLFADVAQYAGSALLTYDDDDLVRSYAQLHGFQIGDVAMKTTHHVVMKELTIFKH